MTEATRDAAFWIAWAAILIWVAVNIVLFARYLHRRYWR